MNETFSDTLSTTSSAETAKFKIAYGERKAFAVEFSLDYLKNESTVFSTAPGVDGDKYGLNVELVKAFDWDIFVFPYFKAGFGAGYFDIEHETKNSLNYSSFNLGLGCFIPINAHFDFEVGYDYKYISYEKIEKTSESINSNMHGAYAGFNVRF